MAETQKGGVFRIIGLMSGPALDGVDAALLETDGEDKLVAGAALTVPYDSDTRALLRRALDEVAATSANSDSSESLRHAERILTEAHIEAVNGLLGAAGLSPGEIDYLGFPGLTVLHRPRQRRSWQIGDAAALARATGISVVHDFRSQDIAAGGQGGPLAALYHRALARQANALTPMVVLNLGGVASLTYIGGDEELLAFDTGPGTALIDDWMMRYTAQPMDRDGIVAKRGTADHDAVVHQLAHPYFVVPPPKAFDRTEFGLDIVEGLSLEDGAATLTALTALAIVRGTEHFPKRERGWIVSGKGRHNGAIMEALRGILRAPMLDAEKGGWRGDFLEAEAIAYLAARSMNGLPLTLPGTTGVPSPTSGGKLIRPD